MFLLWRKPEMIFEMGEIYLTLRWGLPKNLFGFMSLYHLVEQSRLASLLFWNLFRGANCFMSSISFG